MPSLAARLLSPLLVLQPGARKPTQTPTSPGGFLTALGALGGKYEYSVVDGFFAQSAATSIPSIPSTSSTLSAAPDDPSSHSFGLLDRSPERWHHFQRNISYLNAESDEGTSYKVLFVARHGQGWHNVAETKYGTPAWDAYWSKLNGDEEMTWGPDAHLTPLGRSQASHMHALWTAELADGAPLPGQWLSSPLSRAASTLQTTWEGLMRPGEGEGADMREGLREVEGVHTCDKRRTKSYLAKHYPSFTFEDGFAEEDELWKPDYREPDSALDARIRGQLDRIFSPPAHSPYVSITAHGGVIGAFLRVTGHPKVSVPPGEMVPIVVKARRVVG
ncbi:hypothetical protein JCM8097_000757 [Rhodosporidiobolus ruineniae]